MGTATAPVMTEQKRIELQTRLQLTIESREAMRAEHAKKLAKFDRQIRDLRDQLRVSRKRLASELDPHQQAGHGNVETLESVFARHRTLTQAEAGAAADVNSGTTSWAIRALVKDGAIVPTGKTIGRSPQYRYVPRQKRRETVRAPGA